MTPQRRTQLYTAIGAIATAATVLLTAIQCAGQRVDAAMAMKLDVTRYEKDQVSDSAWKAELRSLMLDALCSKNVDPTNRRCRP